MFKKQLAVFAIMMAMISICALSATQENYGVIKGSKPSTIGRNDRIEAAATTFDYLWYWPAEAGSFNAEEWQFAPQLQPGTDGNYAAHFRDVALGAAITVNCNGLVSGETWSATWTSPTGAVKGTSTLTYQNGCFYGGLWYTCECGWPPYISTNIFTFYTTIQCSDTGVWTVDLAHNGEIYATKQINILPQVDTSKLHQPLYNQLDYNDPYDSICHSADGQRIQHCPADNSLWSVTIAEKGCALTSICEILSYHGVNVTPPALNTWLKGNHGYYFGGSVKYTKVSAFAKSQGKTIYYVALRHSGDYLQDDLCKYGPQAVHVKSGTNPDHWVTAYGRDQALTTWLVADPYGGVFTDTNEYSSNIYDVLTFCGPEFNFTDRLNAITFGFYCPVEAYVVDPLGRKMGFDPIGNKTYDEIPNSAYHGPIGGGNPDDKFLDVIGAVDGDYLVTVVGTGTGPEKYAMETVMNNANNEEWTGLFENIQTGPGTINKYLFHYDSSYIQGGTLSGGFDGGGQRPKDVNKFLTYANPSDSQTDLPAGTATFPLMIFYGNNAITSTFKASLNGVDVTNLFNPLTGNYETVNLLLSPGRNVLSLSTDGNLPTRVATDTDRLVFIVK